MQTDAIGGYNNSVRIGNREEGKRLVKAKGLQQHDLQYNTLLSSTLYSISINQYASFLPTN